MTFHVCKYAIEVLMQLTMPIAGLISKKTRANLDRSWEQANEVALALFSQVAIERSFSVQWEFTNHDAVHS